MEENYLSLLRKILVDGEIRTNRTGVQTRSIFSAHLKFDISTSIPLLTTKKVWFKGILHELLWMISGSESTQYLRDHNVAIWEPWSNENKTVGRIYGVQWRQWTNRHGEKIDQLASLITTIQKEPFSRRHILLAWNPGELDEMSLPPCHILAQFYVSKGNELSCQYYQRSVDSFIGLPFNLVSYALLTKMIARICGLTPKYLHFIGGDVHVYMNHLQQVKTQLDRTPFPFPNVRIADREYLSIDDFSYTDFELRDYKHHPELKAPIAV